MTYFSIERRRLIETIATIGILTTCAPVFALAGTRGTCWKCLGTRRLVSFLRHRKGVQAIGRSYLQLYPQEADAEHLFRTILNRNEDIWNALASGGASDIRASIRTLIVNDFAESRTVCLEGWILSQTEVRLCGLTCLVSSRRNDFSYNQNMT